MDLDWCLICSQKTQGSLYCSEECRFKDYLSAYDYLTPPGSPTTTAAGDLLISTTTPNTTTKLDFTRKKSPALYSPVPNGTKTRHGCLPPSPTNSPTGKIADALMSQAVVSERTNNNGTSQLLSSKNGITHIVTSKSSNNLAYSWEARQRV